MKLSHVAGRCQGTRPRIPAVTAVMVLGLAAAFYPVGAMGDDKVNAQTIMKGITDSFALPYDDLYQKKYDSEWRNLIDGFSGNVVLSFPLKDAEKESRGGDSQQRKEGFRKTTLTASCNYNPLSYWFASVAIYGYADFSSSDIFSDENQADWDGDFTYSFGYSDWHPFTLGLVYANYGGNRFNPDKSRGEEYTKFDEGTFSLDWKLLLPEAVEQLFTVHETGGLAGAISYNLTPAFNHQETGTKEHWKQSVSLTLKYTIYKWWYVTCSLYYYPQPWQQQPWDPDFTYGFGYFDWHPGSFSLQYSNFAGNKYPWKSSEGGGDFRDGSVTLSWSWKF